MTQTKAGKSKSEFWWATIAGANCEPVELTWLNGERVAYTCGCADPFYIDRPDCPCVLVPLDGDNPVQMEEDQMMTRPRTPKQELNHTKYLRAKAKTHRAPWANQHGWRGSR